MRKSYTIQLDRLDVGQLLDGLEWRDGRTPRAARRRRVAARHEPPAHGQCWRTGTKREALPLSLVSQCLHTARKGRARRSARAAPLTTNTQRARSDPPYLDP